MDVISLSGNTELAAWLAALPGAVRLAFLAKAQTLAESLATKVDAKLSGEVLTPRSGTLRSSISSELSEDDSTAGASVFVAGDVPYAAILEYGGVTKAHVIEAANAKALVFSWQGKDVFFKYVNHPGSVIEAHSYLRSSLDETEDEIVQGVMDALDECIDD